MSPVRVLNKTIGLSAISIRWDPVVEWNSRGGLDMIAYYVSVRASGGSYSLPVAVYPLDARDPAETAFTFTGLVPNTVYYFRVWGENTACTLLEQDLLPSCCQDHRCSLPSDDSDPMATLLDAMPAPFLAAATETTMLVQWPALPGTPGNLETMIIDYQDVDRPSKDASDVWFRVQVPGAKTTVLIEKLQPNNRYIVRLKAIDTFQRLSSYGPAATLVTRPLRLQQVVRIAAVEATSVSLEWDPPQGRANNIVAYNISITLHLGPSDPAPSARTVTTYVKVAGNGSLRSFRANALDRNSYYSFSVSPTNAAGDAKWSNTTAYVRTLLQDAFATCSFYASSSAPANTRSIQGTIYLFRASQGIYLDGEIRGLLPALYYSVVIRPYGLDAGAATNLSDVPLVAYCLLKSTFFICLK